MDQFYEDISTARGLEKVKLFGIIVDNSSKK